MNPSNKNYRRVFESHDTGFIYVELSFYNKLFDKSAWDIQVGFKCYRLHNNSKELLCTLEVEREVSPDDNVIYIRDGWGDEEAGMCWSRGDYVWEAYVNKELVGAEKFFVEDGGLFHVDNPYFELLSAKLYEGDPTGVPEQERKYLKCFNADVTSCIWAEITFENLQTRSWYCELMFSFYNEAGRLKGRTNELMYVKASDETVQINSGWGSEDYASWHTGNYKIEVSFMGHLIAVIPFKCGHFDVEGTPKILAGDEIFSQLPFETVEAPAEKEKPDVSELLGELNQLVGLEAIKEQVRDLTDYLSFLKLRKEHGFTEDQKMALHAVFSGNPGTGKTTMARLLGKIYYALGAIEKDVFIEAGRAELIGQYIGQTAPKVKEIVRQAKGGVLFIDEAYALARADSDEKDYGKEALEILVKEMEDEQSDVVLFCAGYSKEMDVFLEANPGLKSRFANRFAFEDYTPPQLAAIALLKAEKQETRLTHEAEERLKSYLTDRYRARDKFFGNARLVERMMEKAKMNLGVRVMRDMGGVTLTHEVLSTICVADITKVFDNQQPKSVTSLPIDEKLLSECFSELEGMVGLGHIKKEFHELAALTCYYQKESKDYIGKMSFHTVCKGAAGTGKTSIARLYAKLLKVLGILERGHLVETTREGLVAGFVGQTAAKTQSVIDKAMGGVLFIDEAYGLTNAMGMDFGKEVIETLLQAMENHRGKFAVIVAGYSRQMEAFLSSNPGLASRFDRELFFPDYNADELKRIATNLIGEHGLGVKASDENVFAAALANVLQSKGDGNARFIRRWVEALLNACHLRYAESGLHIKANETLWLDSEDFRKVSASLDGFKKTDEIGF